MINNEDDEYPKVCFQCGKKKATGIKVWNESGSWMADVCDDCMSHMLNKGVGVKGKR